MSYRNLSNSFVSRLRLNQRKAAVSIITITILLLAGVASTLGTTYFYIMNKENVPAVQITNLASEQVLQAGAVEIRGKAAGGKGDIQAILVKVDGGAAVFATPNAVDDFSSWSALVELPTSGTHNIDVEVVDAEGKTHSTTQSVTITEPAPTLVPPPNQAVEATGADGAYASYPSPEVKGDKTGIVDQGCTPASGSFFPMGITEVTCTATQGNGGTLAANFTLSVRDSTPPTIEAPRDVTRKNSDNSASNGWLGKPTVSDIVDDNPSISNDVPFYGFPIGTTAVVWTATDDYGNFAQAVQMVSIKGETTVSDEDEGSASTNQTQTSGSTNGQGNSSNSSVTYGTGGGGGGGGGGKGGGGRGGGSSGGNSTTSIDSIAPSVTITSPMSGGTILPGALVVNGTSSDNVGGSGISSLQVRLDGGQYITATPQSTGNWSTWFVSLGSMTAGQHTVYARAYDNEGNIQEVSISITAATASPNDTTPPTVMASPLGGVYSSSQSVTLAASEAATIYFTSNGNTPTTSSSVYSSPISITSTATLKFIAVDAAGNMAAVATQEYVIDTIPPSVTASPAGGSFGTPQSVVLTTDEPATIYYTSNGATPTTSSSVYSSPISITSTTTLRYFARDAAGNSGGVVTRVFTIDSGLPTASASPLGGIYPSAQSVTLLASEQATIYYTLDGSNPTTSSTTYSSPISVSSTTTLKYFARDGAGNSGGIATQVYTIDVTLPTVIASPIGGTYGTTRVVTLTSSEQATIHYTSNGATPTTSSSVYSSPISISSTTTLRFRAVDVAGNIGPVFTQNYVIDNIAPTVTPSTIGGTYSASQTIALTASEQATVYYTTNGATPTTSSSVYSSPISITSTTTLRYFARDAAGNTGSVSIQVYTIDTTAPTVTASPSGTTFTTTQTVTLTASEQATVYYTTNGATPTTSSSVYSSPISITSTTTLRYFARDAAGNTGAVVSQTYTLAPQPPSAVTITITSPTTGAVLNMAQGFTVSGLTTNLNAAAVQSIGVKAVNPSNSADDIGYVYATSTNGFATWTVSVVDPSSPTQTRLVAKITYNSGPAVYSTPVDVNYGSSPPPPPPPTSDTIAPDTSMTSVRDGSGVTIANGGSTSSATLTIVFTGSDNVGVSRFEGRLDNGPWNTVSSPLTLSVAQGTHDYDLRSVDAASNVDATPASTAWTVSGGNPPPPPAVGLPASVGPVLTATSLDSMFSLIATAAPGQWVELADGAYDNPASRTISRSGVIVKAETVGGVTITGNEIDISGRDVWFHGFNLQHPASGDTMEVTGDGSHIVRNTFRFTGSGISEWLVVRADNVEVAYNDFGNKASQGTFVLHGTGSSHYTGLKMHHNYFHDHSGSGTPAEAYRIGSSQSAWLDFQAEIYNNRFERINGETELVTNKGSGINIHDNTFIDCNSSVTFRHGNNNRVENNIFIHTGVRIYGHGHIVRGNQIIDDSNNQLRQSLMIGAGTDANDSGSPGQPGSSNSIHSQVRDTMIENNIIVNTRNIGSLVSVQLGFSSITAPFPPIDNTIRNNIIYGTNTGTLTGTDNSASWSSNSLSGNIVYATGSATRGSMPSQNIDPLLQRDADGIYRFTANSPLTWTQNIRLLATADVGPLA